MAVLETISRRIRELRKWTLGPIGAVLLVLLVGVILFAMLETSGGDGDERRVRDYFVSARGGRAPSEEAHRIEVSGCKPTYETVSDQMVFACNVAYRGESHTACFAWDGDRVVAGSRELTVNDCVPVHWSKAAHALVSP